MAAQHTAFASDFDGTLCWSDWTTGEQRFDPRDLEAVRAYQQAGGLFGVCTGRPLSSILESVEGKIELDFYIVMTGSQVFDHELNKLWERVVDRDVAQELFDRYASPEAVMVAVTESQFVSVHDRMGSALPVVASLSQMRGDLYGVSFECAGDRDAARAICADINERYGDVVSGFQNLGSVDIVPVGCSKGSGVRVVREAFGVDIVAGIGDSYNDLPLLSAADVAYTFGASPAEVRGEADVVIETLADAIEDFSERIS